MFPKRLLVQINWVKSRIIKYFKILACYYFQWHSVTWKPQGIVPGLSTTVATGYMWPLDDTSLIQSHQRTEF